MANKTTLEKLYVLDSPYDPCSESYLERLIQAAKESGYIPSNDFETVLEDLLARRVEMRSLEASHQELRLKDAEDYRVKINHVKADKKLLRDAGMWVLNVVSDVGKAGGKPESGETKAAFDSLKAALAAKGE